MTPPRARAAPAQLLDDACAAGLGAAALLAARAAALALRGVVLTHRARRLAAQGRGTQAEGFMRMAAAAFDAAQALDEKAAPPG